MKSYGTLLLLTRASLNGSWNVLHFQEGCFITPVLWEAGFDQHFIPFLLPQGKRRLVVEDSQTLLLVKTVFLCRQASKIWYQASRYQVKELISQIQ